MAVLPLCVVPPVLPRVAVVMGSDSDLPTMEPAAAILRELGVEVEVRVLSAHRTPLEMVNFAQAARGQGFGVIVAGAGGAAHLPGMVAALTTLPVIGVPVKSRALSGVDSLHSIVQMPGGFRWPPSPSVGASMPACWRRRSFRWPTLTWPGNLRITAAASTMLWSPRMRAWLIWAARITSPR